MKVAFISDIHGNPFALEAVLDHIKTQEVDQIICLGDLVGYHTFPNEVIQRLRDEGITCLLGNHDLKYLTSEEPGDLVGKFMAATISLENRRFLESLPREIQFRSQGSRVLCVHGSPKDISEYLYENEENTLETMASLEADVLLAGHTHLPLVVERNNKWYINPGSVGKPKIGQIKSTYALVTFTIEGIDPQIIEVTYDNTELLEGLYHHGFPEAIIASAKTGV